MSYVLNAESYNEGVVEEKRNFLLFSGDTQPCSRIPAGLSSARHPHSNGEEPRAAQMTLILSRTRIRIQNL